MDYVAPSVILLCHIVTSLYDFSVHLRHIYIQSAIMYIIIYLAFNLPYKFDYLTNKKGVKNDFSKMDPQTHVNLK
ncbi:uncharacterized protein METZ01_LOCUS85949 [marine metagenome]|uniref:Uncharacterized protein n=1 Tax=marine metagenome TaxID=408172 RepID=A0A381UYC7_9ZZZZ